MSKKEKESGFSEWYEDNANDIKFEVYPNSFLKEVCFNGEIGRMRVPIQGHPEFKYIESLLLPNETIRENIRRLYNIYKKHKKDE